MRHTKAAFRWLISILRKQHIRFEIFGGFDAKIFGSKRTLADIDVLISDKNVYKIAKTIRRHVIFGPKRYHDHNWNILLITLRYQGQEIDICGVNSARIFDRHTKKWIRLRLPISKSIYKIAYGKRIPVVSQRRLIKYKSEISRRVDKADVAAIRKRNRQPRISRV